MPSLFSNIRLYVLLVTVIVALGIYGWVQVTIPPGPLFVITVTKLYGLTAVAYLYVALLIGPLLYVWRGMPYRGPVHKSRRAIGVSSFFLAVLHSVFAFFGQLGGFRGLLFLDTRYFLAITLSFLALIILSLLAATSFNKAVVALTPRRWKQPCAA